MDLFSPDFPFENMLKGKWQDAKSDDLHILH